MSIIPKSKTGDCSECNAKNTACVKVGKSLYCISCRNAQKAAQYMINHTKKSNKVKETFESDRQSLVNDLDFVFSRYIRIREANNDGIVSCFTCQKLDKWTNMQCGHFIKRGETLLRWDVRNAKCQCPICNVSLYGNMDEYEKRLNEETPGLPDQLREESREVNKFTREYLKELLIEFRYRLKLAESKLNN